MLLVWCSYFFFLYMKKLGEFDTLKIFTCLQLISEMSEWLSLRHISINNVFRFIIGHQNIQTVSTGYIWIRNILYLVVRKSCTAYIKPCHFQWPCVLFMVEVKVVFKGYIRVTTNSGWLELSGRVVWLRISLQQSKWQYRLLLCLYLNQYYQPN